MDVNVWFILYSKLANLSIVLRFSRGDDASPAAVERVGTVGRPLPAAQ